MSCFSVYKFAFFLLFFCSCSPGKEETVFIAPENPSPALEISRLSPDTIRFDAIPSSYLGEIRVYKNNLLFIDRKFCYVYLFNPAGKLIKRYLGKGHSPQEVPADEITGYGTDDKNNIILFSDLLYFIYDSTFTLKHSGIVKTDVHYTKNRHGNNPLVYGWSYDKFIIHGNHSKIYYTALNKAYSSVTEPEKFFRESFTILQIDPETGIPEKVTGPYPPLYRKQKLSQFPYCNFDTDPATGNLYICYEADSLIYVFDKNQKNIKTFGWKGRDMNCNYINLVQQPSIRTAYLNERSTKAYYDQLVYLDSLRWICRIYTKGLNQPTDGLQIYNPEYVLIGEIDLPKGYRIAGYIAPSLYLCKADETRDEIQCITFKLDSR